MHTHTHSKYPIRLLNNNSNTDKEAKQTQPLLDPQGTGVYAVIIVLNPDELLGH